jgi:hypothetical protein
MSDVTYLQVRTKILRALPILRDVAPCLFTLDILSPTA